jgi:lipoate-protein ligase B
LGRRGSRDDILATPERLAELGVEVHHVDRGGEVTYHGPGQLVGYPVVNLRKWGGGPLRFVRALEEVLIATLNEFGIEAASEDRPTGVWVGDAKISAIGVKVSRGATTHGFALNVGPDLSYFDHIVPCGMPDGRVTSMASHLRGAVSVQSAIPVVARHLGRVFGLSVEWVTLDELGESVEEAAAVLVDRSGPRQKGL